jgi:hypothetical protein
VPIYFIPFLPWSYYKKARPFSETIFQLTKPAYFSFRLLLVVAAADLCIDHRTPPLPHQVVCPVLHSISLHIEEVSDIIIRWIFEFPEEEIIENDPRP